MAGLPKNMLTPNESSHGHHTIEDKKSADFEKKVAKFLGALDAVIDFGLTCLFVYELATMVLRAP